MGRGGRQRHGADRAEHLLPREPHAGESAGFGDQVLRGAARRPIPCRRRAARAHSLSDRQRDHDRRHRSLPDLCRAQGADRRRECQECRRMGRPRRCASRRAEGHEARKLMSARHASAHAMMSGLRRRLAAILLGLSVGATPVMAADLPTSWVELAADGAVSVRTVVASGASCPSVSADGAVLAMQRRGRPDANFPVEVCEANASAAVTKLAASGKPLPVLPAQVKRIVVIGDTGCRREGKAIQDCGDADAWPFAAIAAHAAAKRPELVIHAGDYYYRERACPAGRAGCARSPHGDNWPTWKAELFDPAAPLLAAAPWVLVRGNHELCRRGGLGWFRLLDPSPARADCIDRTEPYWLAAGGLTLLMFDSSDADDFLAPPDKVAAYAAQLVPALAKAPPRSWLVTHRPVWAMAQADLTGLTGNQTVQAAIRGQV